MTARVRVDWRHPGGMKPPDVVYVGRPSRWGNPYTVAEHGRARALALFAGYAQTRADEDPDWLAPLRGRRLACWCPLGEPCHADSLLTLLDEGTPA